MASEMGGWLHTGDKDQLSIFRIMGARILSVVKVSYKYGKEENETECYGVRLKLEISL